MSNAKCVPGETPKKFYSSYSSVVETTICRLCKSVGDVRQRKNLFSVSNRPLLGAAEQVYGSSLPRKQFLPHILCRPCERRLKNFMSFKATVQKCQQSFDLVVQQERAKRCIEVSPSAPRILKSSKTNQSARISTSPLPSASRRGLDFQMTSQENKTTIASEERSESRHLESIVERVNKELSDVSRRDAKSVLRERNYPGMVSMNIDNIIGEMKKISPTVYTILSHMLQFEGEEEKIKATLALIFGLIMFRRCNELSLVQRINTLLLVDGNATQEVLTLNMCHVAYSMSI